MSTDTNLQKATEEEFRTRESTHIYSAGMQSWEMPDHAEREKGGTYHREEKKNILTRVGDKNSEKRGEKTI